MGGAQSLLCRSSSTAPDTPLTPISRSRLRLCDESEFRTRRPTPTDASQDVIGHLEDIGRTFQDIFGVIGEQIHFIFTSTWPTDPFQAALARLPNSTVTSSRAYSYSVSYSAIAQFFGVELVKESDFDIALHPFHAPSCRVLMLYILPLQSRLPADRTRGNSGSRCPSRCFAEIRRGVELERFELPQASHTCKPAETGGAERRWKNMDILIS